MGKKYIILIVFSTICLLLLHCETSIVCAYRCYIQHLGHLVVSNNEVLIINSTEYLQNGDVIIKENGNLTIINSNFCMTGESQTYITVLDNGTLKVASSELTSRVHVLYFRCYNNSRILFEEALFSFWGSTVIELWGNSTASFENTRQREWVQVETSGTTTVTFKNSTIAMIQADGSSTILFQDSNITHGSYCSQCATLVLKHSNSQWWLDVKDSSKLIATEYSTIEVLWLYGSSNTTINNSHVNAITPSGASKILLTNSSSVDFFEIDMPAGYSRISDLKGGYIENYTFYEERTGLGIDILKSTVRNLGLDVGSNSHLFLEDCMIDTLSVSSYGSVTIYNSEVEILYCYNNSLVILWNSKTSFPVQSQHGAVVRYFSTVDLNLFYMTVIVAIILALALIVLVAISVRKIMHARLQSSQ